MSTYLPNPFYLEWNEGPLPAPEAVSDDVEVVAWISTVKGPLVKILTPTGRDREWCDETGHPINAYLDGAVRWWAWLKKP